jgi:hypothetical protein
LDLFLFTYSSLTHIAELALVKDTDFHHFVHLLSRKQKKPASEKTSY